MEPYGVNGGLAPCEVTPRRKTTQELFRVCSQESAIIRDENSFTRDSPAGDIVTTMSSAT
jgi:hypothetical protein